MIKQLQSRPFLAIPRGKVCFSARAFIKGLLSILSFSILKGKYIQEFERQFANYIGIDHAIATYSGTASLRLCLEAINVKEGGEIICPAYMVPEVVHIIRGYGLKANFVDVAENSFNINPDLIEEKITPKTKAIIMAHMYGNPCDIDRILDIARKNDLVVIEDCAQACGAEHKQKKVGAFGDLAYFSFGMMKNLNTLGGGMIVTNNGVFANKIREKISGHRLPSSLTIIRKFIFSSLMAIFTNRLIFSLFLYPLIWCESKFNKEVFYHYLRGNRSQDPDMQEAGPFGCHFRFTNMQALIGLEQLRGLDQDSDLRIRNAEVLNSLLRRAGVCYPKQNLHAKSIYVNYVMLIDKPKQAKNGLLKSGIDSTRGYIESFSNATFATRACETNLYIPMHSSLSEGEMLYVGQKVIQAIKGI